VDAAWRSGYMSIMNRTSAQAAAVLADLNEPQRRAVTHREGPLLVLAGPGSGKTRVITRRAAYLVHTGVPPRNILAITFTNKAADEMKKRIAALGVAGGMWVHTFHALGVRLLREFGPLARVQPGFVIYDESDQKRVIKEAMKLCGLAPELIRPDRVQEKIGRAKDKLRGPEEFLESAEFFDDRQVGRVYEAYEQLLEQRNAVDFDDLLMRVALVLRDHPDITERLNVRFRHLLIDEYQDTNHAQYLIARHLSQHHHNICATGDPDQSIYGWRGADIGNILEFERDYPDAVVVRLEQNYRSGGYILKAASKLIRCNRRRKHKDLWTRKDAGEPVGVWQFAEGRDEAERIADTILELREQGRSYNDFAIMYRVNAVSRGLEEALRHRGIPYKIARGVEFYNRKEIRDTLAYLRLLVNPGDQIALLRIINTPARKIGKTTIGRLLSAADDAGRPLLEVMRKAAAVPGLKTAAARVQKFVELLDQLKDLVHGSVADAVSNVLARTGLEAELRREREEGGEDRLANVEELVTAAARYDEEVEQPSLEDFLQRVALTSDQDSVDESAGVVLLMTLHAAKGLEFPVVFIVGLEQGLLPHERSLGSEGDLEEERRLCFVGITRAMERLYLSHAQQRLLRGALLPRCQSQFLDELPDDATEWGDFGADLSESAKADDEDDGFVPLDDQLPPTETRTPRRPRKSRSKRLGTFEDEPVFSPDDPTGRALRAASSSPYAEWKPGMLVTHERYGVGTVQWIRPGGGQTRASIRFARHGQKTFILEIAPVRKLERGSV
jgi:DNA helicase-2/ATP-dependent DNA helicase PcrA